MFTLVQILAVQELIGNYHPDGRVTFNHLTIADNFLECYVTEQNDLIKMIENEAEKLRSWGFTVNSDFTTNNFPTLFIK